MKTNLRIMVMTQNDDFFIPHNIKKLMDMSDVIDVVEIDCKSSLSNKLHDYYEWFGFIQCAKMGYKKIYRTLQRIIDRKRNYKYLAGECSVYDIAKANNVHYMKITNSNSEEYIDYVTSRNPDLIVSYSAPQVIKEKLLSIPKYGIINVHGSLLPNYRGLLPSFWYLYNDEKIGGATVHYMSEKIDDGDIIVQETVDISECKSMFQVMMKTKKLGGELIVKAVEQIANGTVQSRKNIVSQGSYFTWPTKEDGKKFRKKGYRLY